MMRTAVRCIAASRTKAALLCTLALALANCGGGTSVGGVPGSSGSSGSGSQTTSPGGSTPMPTPKPGSTSTSAPSGSTPTSEAVPFPAATDSDPFYAQPGGIAAGTATGTILASRTITYEPDATPMTNKAWQLRFVSKDRYGNLIPAVSTVVLPLTPTTTTTPLFVESFAEDALGAQCAPSHDVTGGTGDSNAILETPIATAGLAAGWIVDFPDHEGPNSEYAVGPSSGQIVLDSIRAAENFAPLGINVKTPVGINGYSGGAIATAWAATLEKQYAPELNIVAASTGGTPADIVNILMNIDSDAVSNAAFFDIIFMAGVGINRGYPDFIGPLLNAKGVAAAQAMENGCVGNNSNGSSGPTGTIGEYTTTSPFTNANFLAAAALDGLAQKGHPPIVKGYFVYQSETDELIPIAGVDAMVKQWCADGGDISYFRDPAGGDHITTELDNVPVMIAYQKAKFSGIAPVYPPTTTTCNG